MSIIRVNPARENLRLLSKIALSNAVPEETLLSNVWGGVFYHPDFVTGGAASLGLEGTSKVIVNNEARQLGVSNVIFQKRPGIRAATIPLLFQYFGHVFFHKEYEENYFADVMELLKEDCDYAYLCFTPEFNSISRISRSWGLLKSVTLALTSDDLDKWGKGFRDDVKNKINKAKREKVRIQKIESIPMKLWETSYHRKGLKPPIESDSLENWCKILVEKSLLTIYAATVGDILAAFRGQLIYGGFAYDWIAGSDPDYHSLGTNQLLMAEIGNDLKNKNIKIWDLVDARIKSIADFKKSFGASEYYHWHAYKGFNIKGKLFGALRNIKNA